MSLAVTCCLYGTGIGDFHINIDGKKIFDRKEYGGFPEIKELKQLVRDIAAPGKSLGHTDTKPHHQQ
jgi:selenoprotein W-related protein